jgi:hypothetical protein
MADQEDAKLEPDAEKPEDRKPDKEDETNVPDAEKR